MLVFIIIAPPFLIIGLVPVTVSGMHFAAPFTPITTFDKFMAHSIRIVSNGSSKLFFSLYLSLSLYLRISHARCTYAKLIVDSAVSGCTLSLE